MSDKIDFFNQLAFVQNTDVGSTAVYFTIDDTYGLTLVGPNPVGPAAPAGSNPPNFNVEGSMRVNGDLIIVGDTVTTNVVDLAVENKNILMNVPNPVTDPVGPPQGAGIIIIRDDDVSATPQTGLLWNEGLASWDFNYGIAQDVFSGNVGAPVFLPVNPRLMNIGDPVDPQDAATRSWVLGQSLSGSLVDLTDTNIAGEQNGDVLIYTTANGGEWINGEIAFGDIDGITTPVADGYLFADTSGPEPVYSFVAGIDAVDVTGLATVATTGEYSDLLNAPATVGNYDIQVISNAPQISYTSYVSTTDIPDGVVIGGLSSVTLQAGASDGNIYLQPDDSVVNSAIIIKPTDPTNSNTTATGKIESEFGLELTSNAGSITLQGLIWPNADGTNGQVLSTDGSGTLYWDDSSTGLSYRIENSNSETFVDAEVTPDVVLVKAPDLGNTSVGGGSIVNTTGIILDPGANRFVDVLYDGIRTSSVTSVADLDVNSLGTLSLSATTDLTISDYVWPAAATGTWGQALVVDPNQIGNPAQDKLLFATLDLSYLGDVTVTTPTANNVLQYVGAEWVNADLDYSQLTNAPTVPQDLVDLGDVTAAPVVDGFLRWNGAGNLVVYEATIQAESLNLNGVVTDIVPDATSTRDLGSVANKFSDIHVNEINSQLWPVTDGTGGQVLATSGAGTMYWADGGSGGSGVIEIYDEGVLVGSVAKLNFIGADIEALLNSDTADIYVPPVSLAVSGSVTVPAGTQVLGTTVTDVTMVWNYTPDSVDTQTLSGTGAPGGIDPLLRTFSASALTITDDTTWNIQGTNNTFGTVNTNMSLLFANYIYSGKSLLTVLDEAQIEALSDSVLTDDSTRTYTTGTNGVPEYFYICYPVRINDINVWNDPNANQQVPFTTLANVSVTNNVGYVEDYVVQRSVNAFTGNLTIITTA